MAFTIAATQAAATDGRWPGRGAPSVLGETSAPITEPSGRTRGVSIIKGGAIGGAGTQVWGEKIVTEEKLKNHNHQQNIRRRR